MFILFFKILLVNSVSITPGATALLRILNLEYSAASTFVRPFIANFEDAYELLFSFTTLPKIEDILTILPHFFFYHIRNYPLTYLMH